MLCTFCFIRIILFYRDYRIGNIVFSILVGYVILKFTKNEFVLHMKIINYLTFTCMSTEYLKEHHYITKT